jgi:hypothetical protein
MVPLFPMLPSLLPMPVLVASVAMPPSASTLAATALASCRSELDINEWLMVMHSKGAVPAMPPDTQSASSPQVPFPSPRMLGGAPSLALDSILGT